MLQPTPTRAIIDQAVNAMRAKLDVPGCHFTLDVVEPLPDVLADRDALAMVLVNLLDNAVKYTGEEKRIDLRARDASGRVFISIQDNGLGLSKTGTQKHFSPILPGGPKTLALARRLRTRASRSCSTSSKRTTAASMSIASSAAAAPSPSRSRSPNSKKNRSHGNRPDHRRRPRDVARLEGQLRV